jgi:transcriptional regulator GlxA family with amidase domain
LRVGTEAFDERVFDTVIVVGGDAILAQAPEGVLTYLRNSAKTARRTASICSGAFVLAQAGLLEGRRATTHWAYARDLQARFPSIKVEEDRIYVIDGSIWTSAGMTAGIDLALAMVEKDHGAELARSVAQKLVMYHRRRCWNWKRNPTAFKPSSAMPENTSPRPCRWSNWRTSRASALGNSAGPFAPKPASRRPRPSRTCAWKRHGRCSNAGA